MQVLWALPSVYLRMPRTCAGCFAKESIHPIGAQSQAAHGQGSLNWQIVLQILAHNIIITSCEHRKKTHCGPRACKRGESHADNVYACRRPYPHFGRRRELHHPHISRMLSAARRITASRMLEEDVRWYVEAPYRRKKLIENLQPDDPMFLREFFPFEYPTYGTSDFRKPALDLRDAAGSCVTDLRYTGLRNHPRQARAQGYALALLRDGRRGHDPAP